MLSPTAAKMSEIAQQIAMIRHSVQQKAIQVWQDVRLSNKFLRQTNDNTHHNTITHK